ncbi:MAG: DNA polymerase III subunit beta [Clostridia bacterium]|nr:DNA polymerase III subunit beta [Clostridia bacterium]
MIAKFDKATMLTALIPAMYTVSGKKTMPAAQGVHLTCTDDQRCMIQTCDLENGLKGIRTFIDCEVEESGSCVINAQRLLQIVKTMPDGMIKISVDSTLKTIIESGLSHFDIRALPGSDFPSLPEMTGERGFAIPQYLFKKFVNKILFAIGQDDARPVFSGAYFQIKGDKIILVSCDGNRLAYCEKEMDIVNKNRDGSELNLKFIIPGKTLVEVLKMVKDTEDEIEIRMLSRRYVLFKIGPFMFFSSTIDADYIDYTRIIPKEHNISFNVQASDLRSALERSSLIVEDRLAGTIRSFVKFTIDECLSISTNSANGNVYDEITIEKLYGDTIVIGFNCKFILDVFRVCEDVKTTMSFIDPIRGVVIEQQGEENEKYLYFVMPIRMNQ